MAANLFDCTANTVALTATTAKTALAIKAAANIAVKITEASASFDGATSTNAPAVVEFGNCTMASNATPGTGNTTQAPTKRDVGRGETLQVVGFKTATSEPTVITPTRTIDVGQFNGLYHYIHPFASPQIIPGGAGFVIRVTSPNNVNFSGHLAGEE